MNRRLHSLAVYEFFLTYLEIIVEDIMTKFYIFLQTELPQELRPYQRSLHPGFQLVEEVFLTPHSLVI